IGEDGSGFYATAYNLYLTIYSLAVTGFPVAVAKLVATYAAEGRYRDVKQIVKTSRLAFGILGVIASLALMLLARPYVTWVENPGAFYSVLMVAPSLLFSCLMSVQRGYNQGMKNMIPTAVSQVIEVLFKAACGLGFSLIVKNHFTAEFEQFGTVFGTAYENAGSASVAISSLSAAAVILGVSVSTCAGWLYLAIRNAVKGDGISKSQLKGSPEPHSSRYLLKQILIFVFPIALSSVTVNITGLIDNSSVLYRLRHVIETDLAALYLSHGGWLEMAERTLEEIPNYLYGVYNTAISIFNLVPSLTGSFGMSALPHVTTAWQQKDQKALRRGVSSTLRLTTLIAAPAGFGIAFLAAPIADLLYGSSMPIGSHIAGSILPTLGIAAIFVALVSPINALLQAIGRIDVPVKLMLVGGLVKLASNYLLVGIPSLNIMAAPMGNLLCYFVIFVFSLIILSRETRIRYNLKSIFFKPLFSGLLCGVFARLSYSGLELLLGDRMSGTLAKLVTVAAIGVGALVYLVALGATGALVRADVRSLPGGAKIEKVLEKIQMLR
ncbi:MAG: polysaccharide biosynthesis protein, partial [Oscillospiraceae bacterium]|nr:polysaccharide biosynthesis protein [Oscillospiraceae bacterium]